MAPPGVVGDLLLQHAGLLASDATEVLARYSWPAHLARLDRALEGVGVHEAARARIDLTVISVLLDAVSAALLGPMIESLLAAALESNERARISAMVYVVVIVVTSPFGWIAGQLSALDRSLPFVLEVAMSAIGLFLVWIIGRPGFLHPAPQPAQAD